uniref:Uncharacterized protein n=1 Tax=Arundo donax TaxID=35708 RepID=A0A0A9FGH5_ARUDO
MLWLTEQLVLAYQKFVWFAHFRYWTADQGTWHCLTSVMCVL